MCGTRFQIVNDCSVGDGIKHKLSTVIPNRMKILDLGKLGNFWRILKLGGDTITPPELNFWQ